MPLNLKLEEFWDKRMKRLEKIVPICFIFRKLKPAEMKYPIVEKRIPCFCFPAV